MTSRHPLLQRPTLLAISHQKELDGALPALLQDARRLDNRQQAVGLAHGASIDQDELVLGLVARHKIGAGRARLE